MTKKYWNPLGNELPEEKKEDIEKTKILLDDFALKKQDEFQKNWRLTSRKKPIILSLFILAVIIFFKVPNVHPVVFISKLVLLFFLFIFYFELDFRLKRIKEDFYTTYVSHLISILAQKNGWREEKNLSDKKDLLLDRSGWEKMATSRPEIFQKGDRRQILTNMIWGWVGEYPFWKTIFNYQTKEHNENGEVYYIDESKLIIGFRAKRQICSGYIQLKGINKNWWNEDVKILTEQKISQISNTVPDVEMIDFNKYFFQQDSRGIRREKIYHIFTSVVQKNMIQLWKWCNNCSFIIQNDEYWAVFDCVSMWDFTEIGNMKLKSSDRFYNIYENKINRLLYCFKEIMDSFD